MLVPEWTGPGTGMCQYIDNKSLYPNQYRYEVPGIHQMPSGKHLGFESNAKTTPMAMGLMLRHVERNQIDIPDERIVIEMASYRQTDPYGDEGSFGGAAGRLDDFVSALRILCFMLRFKAATFPLIGDDGGEIGFGGQDESLPAWDFDEQGPVEGLPGVSWSDVGDANSEEALFWAS